MSQEIDQLAARVAGLVRDEVAAAELRGRSAGHAAGQEEMRREMFGQVEALESRISELEARTPAAAPPGAFEESERRQREREEQAALQADNDRLNTRCTQLEAELEEQRRLRPAGIVDEEGGPFESSPEARAERKRLRELRIIAEYEASKADAKAHLPVLPPSDSKKTKDDGKAAKK